MSEDDELSLHHPLLEDQQNEPSAKQCSDNNNDAISMISATTRSLAGETVATIAAGAKNMLRNWKVLLLGQLIALFMVTGFAAADELAEKCDFSAPAFQCSFTFIGLMAHFFIGNIKCCFCKKSSTQEEDDDGKEQKTPISDTDLAEAFENDTVDLYENVDNSSGYSIPPNNSNENNTNVTTNVTGNEGDSSRYTFPFISMPMQSKWWQFFFLSLIEVEARTLEVLALKYTTVTSQTVLYSIATPSAMVCSRFILKWRYGLFHAIGVCICLSGAVLNVFTPVDDDEEDADNKLLGDFLMVCSAILYGLLDTLIELVCKEFSPAQYLYMTGFYGTIISIVQVSIVERDQVSQFFGNNDECSMGWIYGLQTAFTISDVLFYIGLACFLSISEATLLNLSMLTMNIYSVLFSVIFQQDFPHPLIYLAILLTATGIVVYESAPSPILP